MLCFLTIAASLLLAAAGVAATTCDGKVTPKFFIISMFGPEADTWYTNLPATGLGNLYDLNVTVPGLSPIYPDVHCTASHDICQVTLGESEINAASSVSAVVLSDKFNLKQTYFMIAGIAGVSPKEATLGSVTLNRYAVQVALQYEFDSRELPANFSTGYIPFGGFVPSDYPTTIYGTEVFEVNDDLRQLAFGFAQKGNLSDDPVAAEYRARYAAPGGDDALYTAATMKPSVVLCDGATSDVYYSGTILSEAFENTTSLFTNGTGKYCVTAQEDNATLEVMVRAAIEGIVDFARIIVMRTASDFDRPPVSVSAYDNLLKVNQNGFEIAIANIFNAGIEIVKGVLSGWDATFSMGVAPCNYIGDIFGSLGGEPDFGPGSIFGGEKVPAGQKLKREALTRRGLGRRTPYWKGVL